MIELIIPKSTKVYEDPKTKAKTIALPFQLPDGMNCVLMICRLNEGEWKPQNDIKSLTIQFND